MNTPKSVAYGWGALILATGIGYYLAKGVNERRWQDQKARGLRAPEHQDWKDKIAQAEADMRAEMQAKHEAAQAAKARDQSNNQG